MRELRLRRWLVGGVLAAAAAAAVSAAQVSQLSGEWEWNEVTVEIQQETAQEESTDSADDTTQSLAREEEWEWN